MDQVCFFKILIATLNIYSSVFKDDSFGVCQTPDSSLTAAHPKKSVAVQPAAHRPSPAVPRTSGLILVSLSLLPRLVTNARL